MDITKRQNEIIHAQTICSLSFYPIKWALISFLIALFFVLFSYFVILGI